MTSPIHRSSILAASVAGLVLFAVTAQAALTSQLGILDLDANSGINPATGAAWQAGDTYRLAFVTGGTTLATSTEISTYNSFVQNAADNSTTFPTLGSVTWNIIGSTATVAAKDNTSTDPVANAATNGGVFLLDGTTTFANSYSDLWDGSANPNNKRIERTENNIARQGNLPNTPIWGSWTAVWTGTDGDGTANNDPLGGDAGGNVRHGLMKAEPQFWIGRSSNSGATHSLPVYALSETLTVVPESSSFTLLGLGCLGLCLRRHRK